MDDLRTRLGCCVTGFADDRAPPPSPVPALVAPTPRGNPAVYLDATFGSLRRSISGVWHSDVASIVDAAPAVDD